MCDRRRGLRDIARQIGMSFWAVQYILTDILGMSKVSARWVPRMLTKDQKKTRLDISKHLLSLYEDNHEEFMRRVVTQTRHGSITLILRSKTEYAMRKKKVRETSRECHNHKPQPFPNTKRKRKETKPNKRNSNKRT